MGGKGFRDLVVWWKAKDLAVSVYRETDHGAVSRDFGLKDQVRRSAVSIASNIAEGDERDTNKEAARFFYIAKGLLAELQTQLQIAYEVGYIEKQFYENTDAECDVLGRMIGKLIKKRLEVSG
jgi:four helix bundle protein